MFRGAFKSKTARGTDVLYNIGDVVLEQGVLYKCTNPTKTSPIQDQRKWTTLGLSQTYHGSVAPVNPLENQIWISDTGQQYVWYRDINGFQWIEI